MDDDVRRLALPLERTADLDPLLRRIGDARSVLLGEAAHGTHEFDAWRAALTRRLVVDRGFSVVAVEGDWPDCWAVHRSVTLAPDAPIDPATVLAGFDRWPTWMWADREVVRFIRWLRRHDASLPAERRVGFSGLDVDSLWESLRSILGYLPSTPPSTSTPPWPPSGASSRTRRTPRPTRRPPSSCRRAGRTPSSSCSASCATSGNGPRTARRTSGSTPRRTRASRRVPRRTTGR